MSENNPTLRDFYSDMNQHGNADYKRVGDRIVLELDSYLSGWRLLVWEAVKSDGEYVPPENNKNTYFWDAVGEAEFDEYDAGKQQFNELTTRNAVSQFVERNPYNGPRTPYHERE